MLLKYLSICQPNIFTTVIKYKEVHPLFLEIIIVSYIYKTIEINYQTQSIQQKTMFSGNTYENQATGKKMNGLPAKRNSDFNLGWDTSNNQLNNYQIRKSKDVTPKITGVMQHPSSNKQLPSYNQNYQHAHLQRQQQRLLQDQHMKLNYQNQYFQEPGSQQQHRYQQQQYEQQYNNQYFKPDDYPSPKGYKEHFSPSKQALDRAIVQYDNRNKQAQYSQQYHNQMNISQKRAPSRPKQNMKDLIFNNIGVNDPFSQRGNSRRAYTNIILGHN